MKQFQGQFQTVTRTLAMKPQMQLAVKMLQMSTLELESKIAEIIERNPMLLKASELEDYVSAISSAAANDAENRADKLFESDTPVDIATRDDDPQSAQEYANEGYAGTHKFDRFENNTVQRDFSIDQNAASNSLPSNDQLIANQPITLRKHLEDQLNLTFTDNKLMLYGIALIDAIDDSGYLFESPDSIAARIGADLEEILTLLDRMKKFEPAGVFAQNLKECLTIQLVEKGHLDIVAKAVLDNLDLVAEKKLAKISKLADVNLEDVHDAVAEIKSLDPKPGLVYSSENAYIPTVDAIIRKFSNSEWIIELTDRDDLQLIINPLADEMKAAAKSTKDKDAQQFLSDCIAEATWLKRTIRQRQSTLLGVLKTLLELQKDFFEKGAKALKPITMQVVADKLNLHESTISRTVNNKYVSTPLGTFELRYFFSSRLNSSGTNDGVSSIATQALIKDLVHNENKSKPFSDAKIADLLAEKGIDVARRTVSKYREAIGIPTSSIRKFNNKT